VIELRRRDHSKRDKEAANLRTGEYIDIEELVSAIRFGSEISASRREEKWVFQYTRH
jgi:hypothetical protein